MRHIAAAVFCGICLWLPASRAAATSTPPNPAVTPAVLRVPLVAFAPATVTTDQVESNDAASSNFIGLLHPVNYSALNRLTGYYQRADLGGTTFVRVQSSVFASDAAANRAVLNSVANISNLFGGPEACGDEDDAVDSKGKPVDTDNYGTAPDIFGYAAGTAPQIDQDSSCILAGFGGMSTSNCEGDGDNDDKGLPAGPNDGDTNCLTGAVAGTGIPSPAPASATAPPAPYTGTPYTGTTSIPIGEHCAGFDTDDIVPGAPVTTDPSSPCPPAPAFAGPSPLSPTDCSHVYFEPCYLLGWGFSVTFNDPHNDGTWYNIYGIVQLRSCVAEVTVTSRPSDFAPDRIDSMVTAVDTTLHAACVPPKGP